MGRFMGNSTKTLFKKWLIKNGYKYSTRRKESGFSQSYNIDSYGYIAEVVFNVDFSAVYIYLENDCGEVFQWYEENLDLNWDWDNNLTEILVAVDKILESYIGV